MQSQEWLRLHDVDMKMIIHIFMQQRILWLTCPNGHQWRICSAVWITASHFLQQAVSVVIFMLWVLRLCPSPTNPRLSRQEAVCCKLQEPQLRCMFWMHCIQRISLPVEKQSAYLKRPHSDRTRRTHRCSEKTETQTHANSTWRGAAVASPVKLPNRPAARMTKKNHDKWNLMRCFICVHSAWSCVKTPPTDAPHIPVVSGQITLAATQPCS